MSNPIINNQKNTITDYNGKKLMIVSFLEGKAKKLNSSKLQIIGIEVAKMHELQKILKLKEK